MHSPWVWVTGIVLVVAGAVAGAPMQAGASNTPTSTPTESPSPCVGTDATSTADGANAVTPARTTSTGPDRSNASSRPTVDVSYTYDRLPERRAVVKVTMQLDPPEDADSLAIEFRNESTVVEATGLVRNGTGYELTGDSTAEVVYRTPINSTYLGTAGDTWTLFGHLHPAIDVGTGTRVVETFTVDGEGYVANSNGAGYTVVVLGDHDVYRRTLDGETIELAVPAGVSPLYGPRRTIDALANASRSLDIGGKDGVVSAVAPPEIVEGYESTEEPGYTAIQPGKSLIIVEEEATLDAWTHEYVHTRQAYKPAAESMRWLSEGSARYYEILLSVRYGYGNWQTLGAVFKRASSENAVLAEPSTWSGETAYAKGALVLAAIDYRIRSATNGTRTVQDVFRRVNTANSNLTVDQFVRTVKDVGGDAAANAAETYITTRAIPDGFDAFASVYGYEDAKPRRTVTELTAAGPGWNRSLDGVDSVRIGVNETLRITARVSNDGEAPGLARLAPLVSSGSGSLERVDRRWVGRLASGETVTRTAAHRFDGPGRYELGFGAALVQVSEGSGRTLAVDVVPDRDTASVVALEATSNGSADGRVDVTVRLRNDGVRSTFVELPVTVDGERVSTLALVLNGDETRTVTSQVDAPTGTDSPVVAVGNAETAVGSAQWTATSGPETESTPAGTTGNTGNATTSTGTTSPGFGVVTLLAAIVLLAVLARGDDPTERR